MPRIVYNNRSGCVKVCLDKPVKSDNSLLGSSLGDGHWVTDDSNFTAGVAHHTGAYEFNSVSSAISSHCSSGQVGPYPCTGSGWPVGYANNVTCEYINSGQDATDSDGKKVKKSIGHTIKGPGNNLATCCRTNDGKVCTEGLCYQIRAKNTNDVSSQYPGGAIILGIGGTNIEGGHSVEMGKDVKHIVFPNTADMTRVPVEYRMVDCKTLEPYSL